jgi:hypothetical protein
MHGRGTMTGALDLGIPEVPIEWVDNHPKDDYESETQNTAWRWLENELNSTASREAAHIPHPDSYYFNF